MMRVHQSTSLGEETVPVSGGFGAQRSVTPSRGEEAAQDVKVFLSRPNLPSDFPYQQNGPTSHSSGKINPFVMSRRAQNPLIGP